MHLASKGNCVDDGELGSRAGTGAVIWRVRSVLRAGAGGGGHTSGSELGGGGAATRRGGGQEEDLRRRRRPCAQTRRRCCARTWDDSVADRVMAGQ